MNELEAAVLAMWALLPAPEVKILREESPEVVELCQRLHEHYEH